MVKELKEGKRPVSTDVVKEGGPRDIAVGTVRFSIKAEDTFENMQVHAAFKDFCRVETDNSYTQGIKKLLEYYQSDYKIEMIYNKLNEQSVTLNDLKSSIVELQNTGKPVANEEESAAF